MGRSAPIFLLGIFIAALALRLYCLDCFGLWYDEVASIEIARRGPLAIFTDRFGGMRVQTPLHYFLVWLTIQPLDPASSAVLVRLPSAIAGALTTIPVYLLGREMFGRGQGLVAALLISVSAVHIGQSQDARPYTLLIFFTVLSVYCLLRAERTGSARWWGAFVLTTLANLLASYFALTLVMPALVPYLLWVLYRTWRGRRKEQEPLQKALISIAVVAGAALLVALDLLQVHRAAPDWWRVPESAGRQLPIFFARLEQFGIGGAFEEVAQWGLFLLALLGAFAGVRARKTEAVVLCGLIIVAPALILAALRTTNVVFQRYAMFALPFYLLLIGNGLAFGNYELRITNYELARSLRRVAGAAAGAVGAAVLLLFLYSVYLYFSPEHHRRLSFLPDYRGVASYLSQEATPGDLVVITDEPALGMLVTNFYWRGSPPTATYDARDPRLFAQNVEGRIFWVVSALQNEPDFHEELASLGWSDARHFERAVVLREDTPQGFSPGLERIVQQLETRHPDFAPVRTLRGCLFQGNGEIEQAAEAYRLAGEYYPRLGEEFLATARGYLARGDEGRAWREALTSKFMWPGNPHVHTWLAERLESTGHYAESRTEREIASLLLVGSR